MNLSKLLDTYCTIGRMVPGQYADTQRPPPRQLYANVCRISWPAAAEAGLASLGFAIDNAVVGTMGTVAMSAVGITGQPRNIILAFNLSLNTSILAVIARRKGANDHDGANDCLKQGLVLSALLAAVVIFLGYLFAAPIIRFAGASPDTLGQSVGYFRICLFGLFLNSLALTICAAQRGIGNTRVSMTANITATVVRIALAFILINGWFGLPALGITGAAIATVVSSAVSLVIALLSVLHPHSYISLRWEHSWTPQPEFLRPVSKVGVSALSEQLFLRFGMLLYIKLVSGLGDVPYASYIICDSIISMAYGICEGLSTATSALIGQSLGSSRKDLAVIYGGIGQKLSFTVSLMFASVYLIGRYPLVQLFSSDPQVIRMSANMMFFVAAVSLVQSFQMPLSGCLRGAGDTKFVAVLSLVSLAIVRPLVSWALCYPAGLGITGAWIGMLGDQFGRFVLLRQRFRKGKWVDVSL